MPSARRPRFLLALACAVATAIGAVAVAASGSGASRATAAAAGPAKARLRPPRKVNAYPLLAATSADLRVAAKQDACDFAQTQSPRGNSLMILAFRRVRKKGDKFGIGADRRDNPFFSNDVVVRAALEAAGRGYEACRRRHRAVTIVYGNTNYSMSESGDNGVPMSTATASLAGYEQTALVSELNGASPRGVSYAVAGDIEPGFDPLGNEQAKALAKGASSQGFAYYDYGDAGLCPPIAACQGTWSLHDLAAISQKNRSHSLPEIYRSEQVQQWVGVRRSWDRSSACTSTRGHRSRRAPHCYAFYGALSEPTTCGAEIAPWQSWTELRRANPLNHVKRHLVYFNPDCLPKRAAVGKAALDRHDRFPPSIPDRFPESSPATVVGDPDPLVSSSVMPRIVNGWSVQSHGQITQVVAGVARDGSRNRGLLAVARQRARPYSLTLDLVAVPGSGAVKITSGPTGEKAGRGAGHGNLQFAGARGVRGTLSLTDNSLTMRRAP